MNENAQTHDSQLFPADDKDRQNSVTRFFQHFLSAVRQARNDRRHRLAVRRAGTMNAHLRRDLGIEAGVDVEIAVKASAPAYLVSAIACPLANHHLSPHNWPVAGANDNVSWQPKRSWLALA